MLAKEEEIGDFVTDSIQVYVFYQEGGYELCFLDYQMSVSVYEKRIVDYSLKRS